MAALAQQRAGVCQSMGGHRIDQAISHVFLETLTGAQLESQFLALRKLDAQQDAVLQQLLLQRERARCAYREEGNTGKEGERNVIVGNNVFGLGRCACESRDKNEEDRNRSR